MMPPVTRSLSAALVVLMLSALSAIGGASALSSPGWVPTAAIDTVVEPGPPTGLTAIPGNGQVHLSWSAPAYDGGAAIEYYVVYQGDREAANVTGTSATITGLTNGIEHEFSVAAHNKAGTGVVSEVVRATPTASVTVPGPPTGLTAMAGSDQIQLSWNAPSNDGGSAITGYVLYWSLDGAELSSVNVVGTSYMHKGLEGGRTYQYKVAAVNQAGEGGASDIVSVATLSPSVLPSEVVGLMATVNGSAIDLTWSAPASDGGSGVTGYIVYRGTSESGLERIATVTGTSFVDNDAESAVRYHYRVYAVNANGIGVSAVTVNAMIGASADDPDRTFPMEYLITIIVVAAAIVAAVVLLTRRRGH